MMILVSIVYTIYWLIEAWHDDDLRVIGNYALRQKDLTIRSEVNKRIRHWHAKDWAGHAILAVLIGYTNTGSVVLTLLYALMIALQRVLILNVVGNLIAGRSWNYLGQGKIDSLFRRIPTIYYISCAILLAGTIFTIIKIEL